MENVLDIVLILITVLIGFNSSLFFKNLLEKSDIKVINYLWSYHLIICFIFYFYIQANGGDAINYWETVKQNTNTSILDYFSLGFGTYFMYVLNYFPSKILELSLLTGSIMYAFIGFLGFVYFYLLFKKHIKYNPKLLGVQLFPWIFFLPNLHFWTVGIGKDSLLFFCIALFFYGINDIKKHYGKIVLALLLAYFARPHIAAFMVGSYALGVLLDGKLKVYSKIVLSIVVISTFVLFFNSIMLYLRIENFDFDTLSSYSNDKVEKLSRDHTGSSVDISEYPFPLKVFTFLYRPFFFDINGVLALLASFENLILLIVSLKLIKLNPFKMFFKGNFIYKSLTLFLLMGVISFSLILGNLGIMLRQKNMFIPALLFIYLWSYSFSCQLKENQSYNRYH
ncbi:MAG: hypothetical protein R2781_10505 [Flavobacteriaceae bacterium]